MRGLGDFQHAQMRDADSRIPDLFSHIRHVIDILEQILQRPHRPAERKRATEVDTKAPAPSISPADLKLSYTIKEVCKLEGISTATIYQVLGRRELRAVKFGKKNSSWQRTCRNSWTICRRCDEHAEVWRNPSPPGGLRLFPMLSSGFNRSSVATRTDVSKIKPIWLPSPAGNWSHKLGSQ
jgi:excisionase family DNA binding protein